MTTKNFAISHSIIRSGRTISFIPTRKAILCNISPNKSSDSDKYADQQRVFELVGLEILSNAWQGYHCCLFAYGQTGSGKSYSMVGYGANKVYSF